MSEELFAAIRAGEKERVAAMLERDYDLMYANLEHGISPVLLAMYHGHPEIAHLLVDRGFPLDIFGASALGKLARVRELVKEAPEWVNAQAADGYQPLGLACFFGHAEVAEFLLSQGAEVNAPSRNAQMVMPLHSAVASRQVEIAEMLIARGADVNARQAGGFTPLQGAAQNGQHEMVAVLLRHGADVKARSADGKTAFDVALQAGHRAVAEMVRPQTTL
jgi:ankyrin repeat protein